MPNHHETILVVEDEPAMQGLMAEFLTQAGYQVLVAGHVIQALQLCRRHPDPIQLLLTDVDMPSMNGRELAAQARALCPQMRVLYMSGHDPSQLVDVIGQDAARTCIQKPFDLDDLLQKVRGCLHEASDFSCD